MGEQLYKMLGPDRWCCYGGSGVWPEPGEWLRVKGELARCKNGLHLLTVSQLPQWVVEEIEVWEVEADARYRHLEGVDKVVVRRARLVRSLGKIEMTDDRRLAADFAERVLPIFEAWAPCDHRPRRAIEETRMNTETRAGEAAGGALAAARETADGAASHAAMSAGAGRAAWAAWEAERAAERAAVRHHERWGDAWSAERVWQGQRIIHHLAGKKA